MVDECHLPAQCSFHAAKGAQRRREVDHIRIEFLDKIPIEEEREEKKHYTAVADDRLIGCSKRALFCG